MIASVAFRNFKALRATSLKLGPFNLLIGPNGSGKTSLIQALLQLRNLSKLPLAEVAESAKKAGGPQIVFHFAPPHEGVEARLGCVSELVCDLLQVRSPAPAAWAEVRAGLAGLRSFVLDHEAIAAPAARAGGGELAATGGNLAAVLALRRERAPAAFAGLEAEIVRVFPEFSRVVLTAAPDDPVAFALQLADGTGTVAAENLSQGTLYALALLTLAHDPAPPSVVCIEEIDRGIHPRMLREVRDALYRLSYPASFGETRAAVQVVATTQSPYLLDLFRDHPEEIVITQKHGSVARFERLADRADFTEILGDGSLGDLWFSGILGGVPEEK